MNVLACVVKGTKLGMWRGSLFGRDCIRERKGRKMDMLHALTMVTLLYYMKCNLDSMLLLWCLTGETQRDFYFFGKLVNRQNTSKGSYK